MAIVVPVPHAHAYGAGSLPRLVQHELDIMMHLGTQWVCLHETLHNHSNEL